MAGSRGFELLREAWGIELSERAKEEIEANAESLSQAHVEEYLKDTDIRKFGVVSFLPKDIARSTASTIPAGKYMVQVTKIADVTQPAKFQEDFEGGKWRLLALDLSDGDQKFKGIEYHSVKDLGVHLPPGTKLLLISSERAPLRLQNGHLLLEPATVKVLGGNVERLVVSWQNSKEVEEKRLLWRTEGIKKKADGEGAPPWVDFDPKKARNVNSAALKKSVEEERAEWRRIGANATAATISHEWEDRERDGPRFQVKDFAAEADAPRAVKSEVASSAFTHDPNAFKSKGKGKSKGGKDSAGPRRGRGDDWDGGEEKRAPQLGNTLAAFIKPTKKGELPDEAIAMLATPPAAAAPATSGGGWDASSWDAGAWDSAWDEGWSQGGGGWGAGGWSGSGRGGGGKGKGRGGGGGKGANRKGGGWGKGGRR